MRQVDIKGFERYQITDDGRVWSKISKKYLKNILNKHRGYYFVSLCSDEYPMGKIMSIHRLVAEAFIPNPNNYPEVDHINTDKTLNTVENLRWVSHSDNMHNPITLELLRNNTQSEERNRKISEKMKGEFNHRFGKEGYWKGRRFTEEHRQKLSKAHLK